MGEKAKTQGKLQDSRISIDHMFEVGETQKNGTVDVTEA
jgi:hypothetical protein